MRVTRSTAANKTKEQKIVKDTFVAVRDSGRRTRVAIATGTATISSSGTAKNVTAVNSFE
jgi:hypothetical protein